jgi:hypothetical protein
MLRLNSCTLTMRRRAAIDSERSCAAIVQDLRVIQMPRKRGLSARSGYASTSVQKRGTQNPMKAAARDAAAAERQARAEFAPDQSSTPAVVVAESGQKRGRSTDTSASTAPAKRARPVPPNRTVLAGPVDHSVVQSAPTLATQYISADTKRLRRDSASPLPQPQIARSTPVAAAATAAPRLPSAAKKPAAKKPAAKKPAKQVAVAPTCLSRRYTTASNRYHPYRREGDPSGANAARAQQRAQHKYVSQFAKGAAKDPEKERSALAGALRAPEMRPHLGAMGVQLAEDAALDTELVDNLAAQVGSLAQGSGAKHRGGSKRRVDEAALDVLLTSLAPPKSPSKRGRKDTPIVPPPAPKCSPGGTLMSPPKPSLFTFKKVAMRLRMSKAAGRRRLINAIRRKKYLTNLEKKTYLGDIKKRCNKRQVRLSATWHSITPI